MTRILGLGALVLVAAVAMGCGGSGNSNPSFTSPDELPPLSANESDEIKSWDEKVAEEERAAGALTTPSAGAKGKKK